MFASTFGILLFGAKRPFARGGVPAACTLPNQALYQMSYTSKMKKLMKL